MFHEEAPLQGIRREPQKTAPVAATPRHFSQFAFGPVSGLVGWPAFPMECRTGRIAFPD